MADPHYFDSARASILLVEAKTKGCSPELYAMVSKLYWGLTDKADYCAYPHELKQDLVSCALLGFHRYVIPAYRPTVKSTSGAFSYLTWCARTAFQTELKRHYRHVNLATALDTDQIREIYTDDYVGRMLDTTDSLLSNYDHDAAEEETKELPSSDAGGSADSDWVWNGRCYCYRDPEPYRRAPRVQAQLVHQPEG